MLHIRNCDTSEVSYTRHVYSSSDFGAKTPALALSFVAVALASCSTDLQGTNDAPITCVDDRDCPGSTRCQVLSGRCLEPPFASLTLTGATPLASNLLRISFEQELDTSRGVNASSFIVTRAETGENLVVNGLRPTDDPRSVTLVTNFQLPGVVYRAEVYGLVGISGEVIPDQGLRTEFTGFQPTTIPRQYQVIVPGELVVGEPFVVTLNAINLDDLSLFVDAFGDVSFQPSRPGELIALEAEGWSRGTQRFTLRYDLDSPPEDGAVMTIEAISAVDSALRGTSDVVQVAAANTLSGFVVEAPSSAIVDEPFELTVTAVGTGGLVVEDFEGAVTLGPELGNVPISPAISPLFVRGRATFEVTYGALTTELVVRVAAQNEPELVGVSAPVSVGLSSGGAGAITLTAVPVAADAIRLDWTRASGAQTYRVLGAPTGEPLSTLVTLVSGEFSFLHQGLREGEAYTYRVEGLGADDAVLAFASASSTPAGCTPVTQNITAPTEWQRADSPFCVNSPLSVTDSLVIEAGVTVLFGAGGGLTVTTGGVVTSGTREEPVHFTTSAAQPNPSVGHWQGLAFGTDALATTFVDTVTSIDYVEGSRIRGAIFDYADGALVTAVPLSVESSSFRLNATDGAGGAAIRMTGAPETGIAMLIRESSFIQNQSTSPSCQGGGAMSLDVEVGEFRFERNVWAFNDGGSCGGGAWVAAPNEETTGAPIRQVISDFDSSYIGNSTLDRGGAIALRGNAIIILQNASFLSNRADQGGAIETRRDGSRVFASVFRSNIAAQEGGAIYRQAGTDELRIRRSRFVDNRSGRDGGAISATGNVDTAFNEFLDNIAERFGGAILALRVDSTVDTYIGNRARTAGAVDATTGTFERCLIRNNVADSEVAGIRLSSAGADSRLAGNNLWANAADGVFSNFLNTAVCEEALPLMDNYFGPDVTGIADACEPSALAISGTRGEPWPECSEAPAEPTCVGAP